MLSPTHFMVALALAYLLKLPKLPTALAGIIPDIDIVLQSDFPLMHRGIVHTPIMMVIAVVLLYLVVDKKTAAGFGVGFTAHLLTDLITPAGIMLLYPLPLFFTLNLTTYNNVAANLGIILWSGGAILLYRSKAFQDWVRRVTGLTLEKTQRRTYHRD